MFTDPDVTSYLHFKCMVGDHFTVSKILNQDPSKVHMLDGRLSVPPLFYACRYGHMRVCQLLIASGANIHFSRQGWTPLHEACSGNHVDVATLLLEKGVNPNVKVKWSGLTPLMHAARRNFQGLCELLVDADVDVWDKNVDGQTAFDLCSSYSKKCEEVLARKMKTTLLCEAYTRCLDSKDATIQRMLKILSSDLLQEVLSFL